MSRSECKLAIIQFSLCVHTLLFFQLFTFASNLRNESLEKFISVWLILCVAIMLLVGYFGGFVYFVYKFCKKPDPTHLPRNPIPNRVPRPINHDYPAHATNNIQIANAQDSPSQVQSVSSWKTIVNRFLNSQTLQIVLFTTDMLVPIWSLLLLHKYLADPISSVGLDLAASVIVQLLCISTLFIANTCLSNFKKTKLT
jgi:hypothetical protein